VDLAAFVIRARKNLVSRSFFNDFGIAVIVPLCHIQQVNVELNLQSSIENERETARRISAAGLARIRAAQRARWAKIKAGKKTA
jgi:hypothetical protein